ncbi:unnamed protein product [Ectocarpus sp. CCAP 1310/34]|nr:unnamed protein product [Ectocarpus sp. CCAP 1310/34]
MISTRHTRFPLCLLLAAFIPISTAFTGKVPWRLPVAEQRDQVLPRLKAKHADEVAVEEVRALKETILEEAAGTSNGLKATPQQRDAISKAINGLAAANPTKDITTSELATGTWDLIYTTTPGASGGKLGPFIGEVQQEVDIAEGLYVNYVRLGPLTGRLEATWDVVNKSQWKVVFKSIAFLLFGQQLVKNELDQAGLWTLSYLDDDMRVLTARSLERDTGNVYVLARA